MLEQLSSIDASRLFLLLRIYLEYFINEYAHYSTHVVLDYYRLAAGERIG